MRSKNGDKQCACAIVHDDFNHVPRRQQTFPNRMLVQSKTTTAVYSLNGLAVSVIADWSLLLLIVFPDC